MKAFFFLVLVSFLSFAAAQCPYQDLLIQPPSTGYGSLGAHSIEVVSFVNPAFPTKNIEIHYPSDTAGPFPTLFYSHAFGGNDPALVCGLLNWAAKRGYAIVFVPYQTTGPTVPERYDNLLNGFLLAARSYPAIIDTTRTGFVGWSFGGGASFAMAYQCWVTYGWGENGRFIYSMAPWYLYDISQTELQSFPSNAKLLLELYDDDDINDHRMGIDAFNTISIPAEEKDAVIIRSDTISETVYSADHTVPSSRHFNALDYYGIYRLLDALCDYTFNGSEGGKKVALGNGGSEQTAMPGGLKPLEETDNPSAVYPETKYTFPCGSIENPRKDYCGDETSIALARPAVMGSIRVFPNPAGARFSVEIPGSVQANRLIVYNIAGQPVLQMNVEPARKCTVDLSGLPRGLYTLMVGGKQTKILRL